MFNIYIDINLYQAIKCNVDELLYLCVCVCTPALQSLVYRTVKERDILYQHSVFSSWESNW